MKKLIINYTNPIVEDGIAKNKITSILTTNLDDIENRKKYDDLTKYNIYKKGDDSWIDKLVKGNILEEFPEYYDTNFNYIVFTPIGITIFQNSNNKKLVIYDIFAFDENTSGNDINFQTIRPDPAMPKQYTMYNNPLNYRSVAFKGSEFIPSHQYKYANKVYKMFNCDNIAGQEPNDNGYFQDVQKVSTIQYDFKPLFFLKITSFINNSASTDGNGNTTEKAITTNLSIEGLNFTIKLNDASKTVIFETTGGIWTALENIYIDIDPITNIIMIDASNLDVVKKLNGLSYSIVTKCENESLSGFVEVW